MFAQHKWMMVASAALALTTTVESRAAAIVALNTFIGTTAGDDANASEGIGNPINLVHKALRLDDATTLAQGPGTLPAFGFHTAASYPDSQQRNTGFGNATEVRRDRKQDNSLLIFDENNNGVFSESARPGFGMVADGFITFDLDKIRADNGRAGANLFLSGVAGVANRFPTSTGGGPSTSGAILIDGVMVNLFDWTDAGYTGVGLLPAGYDQFDTFALQLSGSARYLTFVGLSGLDLHVFGSDVGFGNVNIELPEPASAAVLAWIALMTRRGRRPLHWHAQ